MFNRIRHIPARFWMTIGIMLGVGAAIALSAGSVMSESDESPVSSIQSHNADIAEVMAMFDK